MKAEPFYANLMHRFLLHSHSVEVLRSNFFLQSVGLIYLVGIARCLFSNLSLALSFTCTHTHARTYTLTHTLAPTYTHAHTHTCTYLHTRTHTHTIIRSIEHEKQLEVAPTLPE